MKIALFDADEIQVDVSPWYFVLQIGDLIYYWDRESGEYDGLAISYAEE